MLYIAIICITLYLIFNALFDARRNVLSAFILTLYLLIVALGHIVSVISF
ncbi:MAG: hypothetical protein LBF71_04005 [Campylobacteraceae bacterium]|nr:hypothetical protein [Campylobacteraceae bacterium]